MRIVAGRWPFTEGSLALTDDAPGAGEWLACHCCGRSYAVENLVRFHDHPDRCRVRPLRRVALQLQPPYCPQGGPYSPDPGPHPGVADAYQLGAWSQWRQLGAWSQSRSHPSVHCRSV